MLPNLVLSFWPHLPALASLVLGIPGLHRQVQLQYINLNINLYPHLFSCSVLKSEDILSSLSSAMQPRS